MLKTVLYLFLVATTAVRFVDLVYLLQIGSNLPVPVIVASSVMVVYGLVLVLKKVVGTLRIKQLMAFYLVQAALVLFNLSYMAIFYPLQLKLVEIVAVGSFLDILIDACFVYYCFKRMRAPFALAPSGVIKQNPVREGSNV